MLQTFSKLTGSTKHNNSKAKRLKFIVFCKVGKIFKCLNAKKYLNSTIFYTIVKEVFY